MYVDVKCTLKSLTTCCACCILAVLAEALPVSIIGVEPRYCMTNNRCRKIGGCYYNTCTYMYVCKYIYMHMYMHVVGKQPCMLSMELIRMRLIPTYIYTCIWFGTLGCVGSVTVVRLFNPPPLYSRLGIQVFLDCNGAICMIHIYM